MDLSGSRYGPVMGSCEHSNECYSTMKGWEFVDQLSE